MSVDYRPDYDPADVNSDYGHTGGDITVPTFTGDTRPFRFWCQKALPLVYDDSLSYYEVLCKMADYLNNFMTDLTTVEDSMTEFGQQFVINQQFLNSMADQLGQNVADLEAYINDRMDDFMTAYTQLQTYVNNYFDNLDVQEEINTKLDEMASDGTLNDLFDPVLETWMQQKTAQIDAAIAGQDAIQAAQNARISVLEGRMDTFSGLPSGSTSGNAELLDIRTNFLGETYPTAGDAVRASDMIASGFQSISATYLEEWDGNAASSVYDSIQIDVSGYKGGHVAVIGTFLYFLSELTELGKCSVYGTNTAGAVADSNAANYYPGDNNSIFTSYTQLTTSISGEERLLLQFAIPDDYAYQYLKIGNFEHGAHEGTYTEPLYIVYANRWSKTQVDPTLTIAGAAADAKAAGDAIDELNERLATTAEYLASSAYIGAWEVGQIGTASGEPTTGSTTLRTVDFTEVFPTLNYRLVADVTFTTYLGAIFQYDAQKKFLGSATVKTVTNGEVFTLNELCKYIKIELSKKYGTTYNGDVKVQQEHGVSANIASVYDFTKSVKTDLDNAVTVVNNLYNSGSTDNVDGKFLHIVSDNITEITSSDFGYSALIPVEYGKTYSNISTTELGTGASRVFLYDEEGTYLGYVTGTFNSTTGINVWTNTIANAAFARFNYLLADKLTAMMVEGSEYPSEYGEYGENTILNKNVRFGNILYNKKLAVVGDSYTAASFSGDYIGYKGKNYGYYIAVRNNMKLYSDGISGSTMAISNPSSPNLRSPFVNGRYQNIPSDTDYLVIWFGINDSAYSTLGTIDDTENTTFFGAWNTVLRYYLTNYPLMKILVIITESSDNAQFQQAVRDICVKWGYPYLDWEKDPTIPALFDKEGMSQEAQTLRRSAFGWNGPIAGHPNPQLYEYESTVIESFLRRI